MSGIRKHFTVANAMMTIALVFVMTGGAYAASKYVISSTKQISPKVLTALKGKSGANGAQGPAGPAGAQGPAGAAGAKGETGAAGQNGAPGEKGAQGEKGAAGTNGFNGTDGAKGPAGPTGPVGPTGSPWTAGGTLPAGATETGSWYGKLFEGGKQEAVGVPISFEVPLAAELEAANVHFAPNPECPGTVEKPEANPGNLCVYTGENVENHVEFVTIGKPYGLHEGAGTSGALLDMGASELPAVAYGTWAVTG
jgi:hypothetical protein